MSLQFIIPQKVLNQALTEAQRFVSSKALSPILGGISFQVLEDAKTLEIRSVSQQGQYVTKVEISSGTPGSAVFPANVMAQVIKAFDSGEISIEPEAESYKISQKTVQFTIPPLSGDEFPAAPQITGQSLVLPRESFLQVSETVSVAASRDETKPVLTSLLLEMSSPNALVTSDGFRLYRQEVDLALDIAKTVLLPSRMLKEVLGIMKRLDSPTITAYWQEESGQFLFELGSTLVQLSVVSGDFPPYRKIIPEATAFAITLDRELLQQRIQQVMVMAKELSSIVILEPVEGAEGPELQVSSQAGGKGASVARLPILQADGAPAPRFACNGSYLLDFLASVDTQDITIQGNDALKPVVITVPGKKELLYLVMPFKLQE